MNRPFNTHTEGLDLDFWRRLFESYGRIVELRRDEHLCRIGEQSSAFGMVLSGYFRYDFLTADDNNLIIGGFAFPGALVGNYPDCMENAPSPFNISAGRNARALIMDATILPAIFDVDPETARQGSIAIQQAYKSLRQRYIATYTKTPAERYHDLITRHPQIEQEIPQKEIAAYLQITPTHLCRIRKSSRP